VEKHNWDQIPFTI